MHRRRSHVEFTCRETFTNGTRQRLTIEAEKIYVMIRRRLLWCPVYKVSMILRHILVSPIFQMLFKWGHKLGIEFQLRGEVSQNYLLLCKKLLNFFLHIQ
jgi:hypothetical protein